MGDMSPNVGHLSDRATGGSASPTRALVLATISFVVSFAAWGLIGALAPVFRELSA